MLLETLSEEVCEVHVGILELFVKVGPRQRLIVDEVDEDVEGAFDIVPSWLVKAAARVQRSEVEIATEFVKLFLLDVGSLLVQVGVREAEVDQVEHVGVVVTHQDVLHLDIIVDEAEFVEPT